MLQKIYTSFIILLLVVVSGSFVPSTYAQDCSSSCKVQDAPATVLQQYIDNVSRVVRNISSTISESEASTQKIETTRSSILASMSQIVNFSGYYSSFDFYVALPITNEVPYPIKRDHERILRENERLSRFLNKITRNGYGEVVVNNACDGVSNCEMGGTARSLIVALIKNNKNITDFYRLSILNRSHVSGQNFILVPENFDGEMQKHYNKDTLTDCSNCEGGFMDRITKSIEKISNLNVAGSEGIRSWKDAWAMITGAGGQSTRTKQEDKLLRDYLGTQGIPGDAADAVAGNLERYNSGGLSTSNPFFNSANYTFTNAKRQIDTFKEGALQNYLDTDKEDIPIIIINKTQDEVQASENIRNDLEEIFTTQSKFIVPQDTGTQKLIAKIMRMHYSLLNSISVLEKAQKVSTQVCESQGQGQGKCVYR